MNLMIDELYLHLRDLGVVQNKSDFSERWLGKEKSYYRGLLSKQREPSVDALAFCASKLRASSAYFGAGKKRLMGRLANQCIDEVLMTKAREIDALH
jgi:hypothetical protein